MINEFNKISRILVPSDGSALSNQAGRYAISLAKQINAEIMGIFVALESPYEQIDFENARLVPSLSPEAYLAAAQEAGQRILKPLREDAEAKGVRFTQIVQISNTPAHQIIAASRENSCDMIAIASHGRSGWTNLVMGSVASHVFSSSDVPVLIYKVRQNDLTSHMHLHHNMHKK